MQLGAWPARSHLPLRWAGPHQPSSASHCLPGIGCPPFRAEWASGPSARRVFVVCVQSHKKGSHSSGLFRAKVCNEHGMTQRNGTGMFPREVGQRPPGGFCQWTSQRLMPNFTLTQLPKSGLDRSGILAYTALV